MEHSESKLCLQVIMQLFWNLKNAHACRVVIPVSFTQGDSTYDWCWVSVTFMNIMPAACTAHLVLRFLNTHKVSAAEILICEAYSQQIMIQWHDEGCDSLYKDFLLKERIGQQYLLFWRKFNHAVEKKAFFCTWELSWVPKYLSLDTIFRKYFNTWILSRTT